MIDFLDHLNYLLQVKQVPLDSEEFSLESADFFFSLLPYVQVAENGNQIQISGFQTRNYSTDIEKRWGTTRITKALFTTLGNRQLSFYLFFGPEMIYVTHRLMQVRTRTSKSNLQRLESLLYENTWISKADQQPALPIHWDAIKENLKVQPLGAQIAFLQSYATNTPKLNLRGSLMAAPPGTGKTLAGFMFHLAMQTEVMIVVAPLNSIDEVWVDTVRTRFKSKPKYWASTSNFPPDGTEEYIFCHYEALDKVIPLATKLHGKKITVWLDESHNMNEMSAQRTQKFIQFCKTADARHVVWASGTPLKAIGSEAVALLTTIDPLFNEEVAQRFTGIYGVTTGRALDILNNRLSKITFKIDKADVVDNPKDTQTIYVDTKTAHDYTLTQVKANVRDFVEDRFKFYKGKADDIADEVKVGMDTISDRLLKDDMNDFARYKADVEHLHKYFDPRADKDVVKACRRYEDEIIYPLMNPQEKKAYKWAISRYKYISLVIRGEALGLVITKMRIDANLSMVPHVPMKQVIDQAEKKTLIFTSYVKIADALKERATELGYHPLVVYGGTNHMLSDIRDKAANDPNANPIIATYPSLSTAVPMTMCNVVWLFDAPFREYVRDQATSRVDRLDQDSIVRILNTLLDTRPEDNITTRSAEILQWSKSMVDAMLGFKSADISSVDSEGDEVATESFIAAVKDPLEEMTQSLFIEGEVALESSLYETGLFTEQSPLAFQNYWDDAWLSARQKYGLQK